MKRTYISLVITMFFWGGTFVAGRLLAGNVSPWSAAFLRFSIASIALFILARYFDGRLPLPPRKIWAKLFLLGLSGVFAYNVLFFLGLQHIEAGRASLIIALNPLAISLCAVAFFKEQLSPRQIGGVVLSLAGAFFVITNGEIADLGGVALGVGELAILGCVISWVTYSLVGRSVLTTLPPLTAVFYSSLVGCLLLLVPVTWNDELSQLLTYNATDWLSLIFLGVFGTAFGFSLYYGAIKKIGAARAGVFINLVPFFSVLLAAVFLQEHIRPIVLIGGIILLSGVTLTNYKPKTSS